jgi:hypothetical protein
MARIGWHSIRAVLLIVIGMAGPAAAQLLAPQAQAVRLNASDIPAVPFGPGATLTRGPVDLFKKHGFTPAYKESAGGHTWLNWRDYLNAFAPQLFQ